MRLRHIRMTLKEVIHSGCDTYETDYVPDWTEFIVNGNITWRFGECVNQQLPVLLFGAGQEMHK